MCRQSNKSYVYSDTHQSNASTQAVKAPLHPCQALNPVLDATTALMLSRVLVLRCKIALSRLCYFAHKPVDALYSGIWVTHRYINMQYMECVRHRLGCTHTQCKPDTVCTVGTRSESLAKTVTAKKL